MGKKERILTIRKSLEQEKGYPMEDELMKMSDGALLRLLINIEMAFEYRMKQKVESFITLGTGCEMGCSPETLRKHFETNDSN